MTADVAPDDPAKIRSNAMAKDPAKALREAKQHQEKVRRQMRREGNDNPNDPRYVAANRATAQAASKVPWWRR